MRALLLLLLVPVAAAHADVVDWRCLSDQPFDQLLCWEVYSPEDIPGPEDVAVFDIGGDYTVSFPGAFTTDRVIVGSGLVTFDLSGGSYDLLNPVLAAPSISVGRDTPSVTFLDLIGGPLTGVNVIVGPSPGSQAFVDVIGADASLAVADLLHVGSIGNGTMTVSDGAAVDSFQGIIALSSTSAGFATVTGPGSTWTTTTRLTAGRAGLAALDIEDGGLVACDQAIIAQQFSSFATVTVRGPGSAWTIDGSLDVALNGIGTLVIEDGGVVTCGDFATIGFGGAFPKGPAADGEVLVSGAASSLSVGGDLWIGFAGNGRLETRGGGTVTVTDDLRQESFIPGIPELVVTLGSSDDYPPPAAAVQAGGVAASVFPDFYVEVALVDGFVPQIGDAFALVSAQGGFVDPVALELPELPAPLGWVVNETSTDLEISVVNRADVNGDGAVDVGDLVAVIEAWGDCPEPPEPCPADIDGDGKVDVDDLVFVIIYWD